MSPVALTICITRVKFVWWHRRESNPHERDAHYVLNVACIPISITMPELVGRIGFEPIHSKEQFYRLLRLSNFAADP